MSKSKSKGPNVDVDLDPGLYEGEDGQLVVHRGKLKHDNCEECNSFDQVREAPVPGKVEDETKLYCRMCCPDKSDYLDK